MRFPTSPTLRLADSSVVDSIASKNSQIRWAGGTNRNGSRGCVALATCSRGKMAPGGRASRPLRMCVFVYRPHRFDTCIVSFSLLRPSSYTPTRTLYYNLMHAHALRISHPITLISVLTSIHPVPVPPIRLGSGGQGGMARRWREQFPCMDVSGRKKICLPTRKCGWHGSHGAAHSCGAFPQGIPLDP